MSIINDALKKVQAKLEQKGSKMNNTNDAGNSPQDKSSSVSGDENQNDNPMYNDVPSHEEQSDFLKQNLQHIQETKVQSSTPKIVEETKSKTNKVEFIEPNQAVGKIINIIKGLGIIIICLAVIGASIFYLVDKMEWGSHTRKIERSIKKQIDTVKQVIPEVAQKISPSTSSEPESGTVVIKPKDMEKPPAAVSQPPAEKPAMSRTTGEEQDLVLSGVVKIEGRKVALINNEIYEPGDMVNGYKIISISSREVELEGPMESIILEVRK